MQISCYDGSLARGVRDRLVTEFQTGQGPGAMVLSPISVTSPMSANIGSP